MHLQVTADTRGAASDHTTVLIDGVKVYCAGEASDFADVEAACGFSVQGMAGLVG